MSVRGYVFIAICLTTTIGSALEVTLPADQRFAAVTDETPSFQRHVLPLFGRLGCNGRACHGSFQGQGGFRLSLFGYDFAADHASLIGGDTPRVNAKVPRESLALQKPTMVVDHGGGERMKVDSWQYRLLLRWIESGAMPVSENDAQFVSLDVTPHEIQFDRKGQKAQLKAVVQWSDGSSEDVTPLCRFQTNDESIASVNESGQITILGPGDTHIVAFYDNGVVPVQVYLPLSDKLGDRYPCVATPTKIDELVVTKLRKLGVVPSGVCTDDEFLRRLSLDMTGSLPSADEVKHFLANKSPDKRSKKIDELLTRPTYAAWWATRLNDWMGNGEASGPLGGEQGLRRKFSEQWYDWTLRRVADNMPYDQIVAGIVLAIGRQPEQSVDDYFAEMSAYFRKRNPADIAQRETMPYFWNRRTVKSPDGKALAFAYSFLGVRLECAQCHKHPYDQWTKQDFEQFSAFFNGIRYGVGDAARAKAILEPFGLSLIDDDSGDFKRKFARLLDEGEVLPLQGLSLPKPRKPNPKAKPSVKAGRVITPRLLGGEEVLAYQYSDPRQPLFDWLQQKDNPYFARAVVNRMWANYFNVGIIDPPDDMNLANAPSNAALLDYLAEAFIEHGYDLKWLHREITNSRTYQRSWIPNATNIDDERNYSRAVVRRLPAEVAYDAIVLATAGDISRQALINNATKVRARAIGVSSGYSSRTGVQYATALFGSPPRFVNCDCERSCEPSLLQTVYLQNDADIFQQLDKKDGWLVAVLPKKQPVSEAVSKDVLIEQAYLRTVSRLPREDERQAALEYLESASDPRKGLRNLLWALLNTKEFILNH